MDHIHAWSTTVYKLINPINGTFTYNAQFVKPKPNATVSRPFKMKTPTDNHCSTSVVKLNGNYHESELSPVIPIVIFSFGSLTNQTNKKKKFEFNIRLKKEHFVFIKKIENVIALQIGSIE